MKVEELLREGLQAIALPQGDREITGVYIGDLLSWVMGRCPMDAAWITIMSNVNVIAVAVLADPACVILSEDVRLSEEIALLAKEKGVNVLSSAQPSYETAMLLYKLFS